MTLWRRALALLLIAAAPAFGQQPTPPAPRADTGRVARPDTVRPRPDTLRPRGDTLRPRNDTLRTREDSVRAAADSARQLIQWVEPDSTMRALLERQNYAKTRYQGGDVTFDAKAKGLSIRAGGMDRVAVQRDSQMVVADSSITYDQATNTVRARSTPGGRIVLHDPTNSQSDLVSRAGFAEYQLKSREATISNASFAIAEGGQTWFVSAAIGRVQLADSTASRLGRGPTTYIRGGEMTSCDDTLSGPDYKFVFKEFKRTSTNTIVARPAILYIKDIPVLWLPFVFQDIRKGRRSGVLTPRFGLSDIIRNNPNYHRMIEDVGYYWSMNSYMDAQFSFDWRSGSGGQEFANDPGYVKLNGEWRYKWLNRFLTGAIATDYTKQANGLENTAVSWQHQQDFTRNSSLTANVNYVTSTRLQQRNSFNPYQTLATIASSMNYQQKLGPASVNFGATRKQYPGRDQVDQTFPTLSFSTAPLRIGEWLSWTPTFNYTSSAVLHSDQVAAALQLFNIDTLAGRPVIDSVTGLAALARRVGDSRTTTSNFDTPIQLFGFDLRNAFRFSDIENDFPTVNRVYVDINDTVQVSRTFARTFRTELDWSPSFSLPSFSQGRWNLSPSVTLTNVDPSPFAVRTELSGGKWVTQKKRPTFSLGVSPTFFGLFPGFGPFTRLRHSVNPTLTYGYAPQADVDTSFLRAIGRTNRGYLGSLAQNAMTLGLSTNIEAKIRSATDTSPDAGEKLKLLSLQFTPLTYDFERARATGRHISGLVTPRFGYTARSDFLPGVDLQVDYSLFEGDPATSDTAVFKPFMERVSAGFQVSRESNPFVVLTRLFGRPIDRPRTPGQASAFPQPDEDAERRFANQPVAGSRRLDKQQVVVPPASGWRAAFNFSSSHPRPLKPGSNVVEADPFIQCEPLRSQQALYDICVATLRANPNTEAPLPTTTLGGRTIRQPPTTTLGMQTSLAITSHWAASWNTTYDFQQGDFASQIVSLQRDLHDWNAVFAFTQSPNGNFAFTFFIALKAQPDLKLDYARASYRSGENR